MSSFNCIARQRTSIYSTVVNSHRLFPRASWSRKKRRLSSFLACWFIGYGEIMSEDVSRVSLSWSGRRVVRDNAVKRRVLGVRPASTIPSRAFLSLLTGPTRRDVWAPRRGLNSHGNYSRRTHITGNSFGMPSDRNQLVTLQPRVQPRENRSSCKSANPPGKFLHVVLADDNSFVRSFLRSCL